jgi:hypothetical protein
MRRLLLLAMLVVLIVAVPLAVPASDECGQFGNEAATTVTTVAKATGTQGVLGPAVVGTLGQTASQVCRIPNGP